MKSLTIILFVLIFPFQIITAQTFSIGPDAEIGGGNITNGNASHGRIESSEIYSYGIELAISKNNFEVGIKVGNKILNDHSGSRKIFVDKQINEFYYLDEFQMSMSYLKIAPKFILNKTKLRPFFQLNVAVYNCKYYSESIKIVNDIPKYFSGSIIMNAPGTDITLGIQPYMSKTKKYEFILGANYSYINFDEDSHLLKDTKFKGVSGILSIRRVFE